MRFYHLENHKDKKKKGINVHKNVEILFLQRI